MPTITDRVEVEVEITPFELGRVFARMDSRDQAQFFDGVATETGEWPKPAVFQWAHLREDLADYPRALECFKGMAEYAE